MNYQETLDFLFNSLPMYQHQGKAAYKSNLNNSIAFDKYLKFPHKSYKTIHIAGTNGKGSSSHMLASILQEEGYKVGLYTSPHLKDFRERIKINGEMIRQEFVIDFIENIREFIHQYQPSFFEMTVFMAFEYFKHEEIDIAIIETGMGGRLDSTNLISPLVSVITNISLDHTQFLGDTIEKIAIEKAGIIKNATPVVIGESNIEYDSVFRDISKQKETECVFANQVYNIPYALNSLSQTQNFTIYKNNESFLEGVSLDLLGHYQRKNVLTVIAAINSLPFRVSKQSILMGLKNVVHNTHLLGRWQTLGNDPLVICDTGHNEAGVRLVLEQIKQTAYKELHIVWGMVNDKSIDKIMSILPVEAHYYFTKASIPRALNQHELQKKANKFGLKGDAFPSVEDAFRLAKNTAGENDMVFVGGSTFVVAEVV